MGHRCGTNNRHLSIMGQIIGLFSLPLPRDMQYAQSLLSEAELLSFHWAV